MTHNKYQQAFHRSAQYNMPILMEKTLLKNLETHVRIGQAPLNQIPIIPLSMGDDINGIINSAIDVFAHLPIGIEFIVKASGLPIYIGEDWELIADKMAKSEAQFDAFLEEIGRAQGIYFNDRSFKCAKYKNHLFAIALSVELIRESFEHVEIVLLHEIGHYMSNIAGGLSLRNDFKKAYLLDLHALKVLPEIDRNMNTYLPNTANFMCGFDRAREEVFAEIFAEIFFDDERDESEKISALMPQSRKLLENIVTQLDDCGMRLRSNYGLTYFDNIVRKPATPARRPRLR